MPTHLSPRHQENAPVGLKTLNNPRLSQTVLILRLRLLLPPQVNSCESLFRGALHSLEVTQQLFYETPGGVLRICLLSGPKDRQMTATRLGFSRLEDAAVRTRRGRLLLMSLGEGAGHGP